MYSTGQMLMALTGGFVAGGLSLFYLALAFAAHEERRPWLDEDAFRAKEQSLAVRRRAIRRGMDAAGPMPASGCADEMWN